MTILTGGGGTLGEVGALGGSNVTAVSDGCFVQAG
jgi:hypothetical protein